MQNRGRIIGEVNPYLKPHEWRTINCLLVNGFSVQTVLESRIKNTKTPDIKMNNPFWEIKSPIGNSARTIESILRTASKQSKNIIIDLRRTPRTTTQCLREIKKQQNHFNKILIITKKHRIIAIDKKHPLMYYKNNK